MKPLINRTIHRKLFPIQGVVSGKAVVERYRGYIVWYVFRKDLTASIMHAAMGLEVRPEEAKMALE